MLSENNPTEFKKETSKNNGFIFGLISGVAVLAVIGFAVFGFMYFKERKDNAAELAKAQQQANEPANQQEQQPEIKIDLQIAESDHVLGNKDAKVKIFEFSDMQCPYCARFHTVMEQLVKAYPNDVAWVFKQFPIQSHPLGMPGAIAGECAADQGKFWEMTAMIFANQSTLTADSFAKFAKDLGLDVTKFNTCVKDNPHSAKISADYQKGIESGVGGTPTSFVNNQAVPGAVPYESLKQIVDGLLK